MNANRNGNFTSSEIFRLMKPGKAKGSYSVDADAYIEECNMERRLQRSIDKELDARAASWGTFVERTGFNKLGIEYKLCSQESIQHPDIPWFWGTPDAVTSTAVADLKCPFTLKSFCQLVDPYYNTKSELEFDGLTIEAVRENHKDGDKFYWQLVGNAILSGKDIAQLIIYCPYLEELDEIKTLAEGNPDYYWIWSADNEKLPYLIKGAHYKNLNVIEFPVPKEDKERLTERVIECGKKLITI